MMETNIILLIALVVCILLNNYIGLYISRKHGAKIRWWPNIIKSRDYTFYLIYIFYIALLVNAILSILEEEYIFPLALLGFIPILLGTYINFVARRDLAGYWTPFASTGKEQKLIKTGIYAKVRHPIYLSGLILSLGFTLIAGNLYGLLFFILSLVALVTRIKKEERELITRFGEEYKQYAKETPPINTKIEKKMRWCHGVPSPTLQIASQSSSLSGASISGYEATAFGTPPKSSLRSDYRCPPAVI